MGKADKAKTTITDSECLLFLQMAPANTSLGALNKVAVRHKDIRKLVGGLVSGSHAAFTSYLGLLAVMHMTYGRVRLTHAHLNLLGRTNKITLTKFEDVLVTHYTIYYICLYFETRA